MRELSKLKTPLIIFMLALCIRLAFLAVTYPGDNHVAYYEDVEIALNVLAGNGYSMAYSAIEVTNDVFGAPAASINKPIPVRVSAIKTPVYPFIIAGNFYLFGENNFFSLFVIHALMAASTVALVYCGMKTFSGLAALISSISIALYPPFVFHAVTTPESTVVTLFLISILLFLLSRYINNTSKFAWLGAALTGGLLALVETVAIPFVAIALVYAAMLKSGVSVYTVRNITLAAIVGCAVTLPWMARNYLVSSEFPMLRTGIGANLLFSLRSAEVLPEHKLLEIAQRTSGTSEFVEDKIVSKTLFSWIKLHPDEYLITIKKNFKNFWWQTDQFQGERSLKYLFGRLIPYTLLLILSLPMACLILIKLFKSLKSGGYPNIYYFSALIIIASYTVVYTLFGANNLRYHFPVQLMLLFLAGELIKRIIERNIPVSSE